jgi:hypothetical protein
MTQGITGKIFLIKKTNKSVYSQTFVILVTTDEKQEISTDAGSRPVETLISPSHRKKINSTNEGMLCAFRSV